MTNEQKKIVTFYALLIAAVIFNFLPSMQIQTVGLIIFFVCFIGLYIARGTAKKASMMYSHGSYMIKSIWISSLFFLIGGVFAGVFGDHSIIDGIIDSITQGVVIAPDEMNNMMIEYAKSNFVVFLLSLLPSILYLLYRFVRGLRVAIKNSSINNPGSWF